MGVKKQAMGIKGIFSSIVSSGAGNLVESLGNVADKFIQTPEEREAFKIEIEKEANRHNERLIELGTQDVEKYLQDTQSARDANVKIQESDKASWLAKNVGYILDIFFPVAFAVILIMIFKNEVPDENKEIFYMLAGLLGGYVGQVVNFHRGTSRSSEVKQKFMEKTMTNGKESK
jgi:hypothetical protein